MNGIVVANSVRVGGIQLDDAIQNFIRRKYNLAIGEPTAEEIKIKIGSAMPLEEELDDAGAGPRPGERAAAHH